MTALTPPHKQQKSEIGFVTGTKDYLISIEGLPSAKTDDLLINEKGVRAIVTALEGKRVEAMVIDQMLTKPGERFSLVGKSNIFSFGDHLFGRMIDALGNPVDGKSEFPAPTTPFKFDVEAGGMSTRKRIDKQLLTGIIAVDMLLPVAKGQRELVFGPAYSGKVQFLREITINQRAHDIVCIYAIIGKPANSISTFLSYIFGENGNQKTIIIASPSSEPTPKITITPSTAMSLAEYFREKGKDVLLIFDDLGTHAKYLREIALLAGRLPGRESYPGDMFYQHARVIERAGNFNESVGGGSITLLPVIETGIENISDLIPTNLMSATDGHLMFSPILQAQGIYPAIMEEQSVTRVGRNSQSLLQKELSTKILALLAQYRHEQEYVRFGAPVTTDIQRVLKQGDFVYAVLRQEPGENLPLVVQITLLGLTFSSFSTQVDLEVFKKNRKKIIEAIIKDKRLQEPKNNAFSLGTFTELLNQKIEIFEDLCQQ